MKEKILEALVELGYTPKRVNDLGYGFTGNGTDFIYLIDDDDEHFLCLAVPGIYELSEANVVNFLVLAEKLNSAPKYVKAYRMHDSLWLFYERELFGGEDLELLLSRMIMHLENAARQGREFLEKLEAEPGSEENGASGMSGVDGVDGVDER
ncbi:MAG: hypothetical protein LUB83_00650 [Prevotellaceae bacterium]|nr:hypothetical protein [Prevotellaceae bacterium]